MEKLERVEERLDVGKRLVVDGQVRVKTQTECVQEVAEADLAYVSVTVDRKLVGREVVKVPEVRVEGDTTIIPVLEERLVIEKRLVLVEEIHVTRRISTEHQEVPIQVRKQTIEIERSSTKESLNDPDLQ